MRGEVLGGNEVNEVLLAVFLLELVLACRPVEPWESHMTYLLQNVEDSGVGVLQGRSQELENMLTEPFKDNGDPLSPEDDLPPSAAHLGSRTRLPAR